MPIQFNLPNSRAGGPNTYGLNESRVEKILNAKTLDAAQHMGFFDKIRDVFRGGTKAEAIRQLYEQVTAPQPHEAKPVDMLHRFQKLRSLAKDEHQAQFTVAHETGVGESQNQWSFTLSVGSRPLYASEPLDEAPGQSHAEFAGQTALYAGMDKSVASFRRIKHEVGAQVADPQRHIDLRVDTMSDDPAERSKIPEKLNDPLYCKKNFQGIEEVEPGKTFKATFQREGEDPVSLLLSDRAGSNNEFRGTALREALGGPNYGNLRELLSRGHMTWEDNHLRYVFSAATGGVHEAIQTMMKNGNATPAEMFAFVRDLHPIDNPYFQALRQEKVDMAVQGQGEPVEMDKAQEKQAPVTLMDICFPGNRKEADLLARFDEARSRLPDALQQLPKAAQDAQAHLDQLQKVAPRTPESYAQENVQTATDDKDTAEFLKDNFDNDLYSRAHFKGVEPGETSATFKAVFQREGEAAQTLVFSNRMSSNREFRGEGLKNLLSEGHYGNLQELFKTGMDTAMDSHIGAIANSFVTQLLVNQLGLAQIDDLISFLNHLKTHGPAELAAQTFEALRGTRIAQTDALELLMGDDAPPVPAAASLIESGLRG